jgi:hypothetical protein
MFLETSKEIVTLFEFTVFIKKTIYIHDHLIGEEDQDFHLKLIFVF